LRVKDGCQTIINVVNNENKEPLNISNSFLISYLIKLDKIYDKNYSASLSLIGNVFSKPFVIDLHRDPISDSSFESTGHLSGLSEADRQKIKSFNEKIKLKLFKEFNKKVVRKNTFLVYVYINNVISGKVAHVIFNYRKLDEAERQQLSSVAYAANDAKKHNKNSKVENAYSCDYEVSIASTNFNLINKFILSAKGADVIFDEIRCGTTENDVFPKSEKKELTEEELLGEIIDDSPDLQPDPKDSFSVSNSFLESIVIIKGGKSVGTGFVAKNGSNNYIYTNVHVLMGNNKMKFINKDGKKLKPVSIETTPGRDIVRLKIKNKNVNALNIAKPPANNTPMGGVIRTLYGKVIGVGPDKVETNAKFINGNSGSPILLEDGGAIAIAAYVQKANINWVNTNTPFTVTRRFAYRIDNIDHWKKISPKTFVREEKIESLIEVLDVWAKSPYWNRIQARDNIPRPMALWIDNQNEWVEHNHMRFKHTRGREANVRNLSRELIKELDNKVEFLKKSFKRSCNTKKRRWTVPFFKDYSDDLDRLEKVLVKAIDHVADTAASTDPVYLKRNR